MNLRAWVKQRGRGELTRLHMATGLTLPTIYRAYDRCATLASAEKLHEATGGEVELGHMTTDRPLPVVTTTRAKRKRAS